jgi:hypothetical protein
VDKVGGATFCCSSLWVCEFLGFSWGSGEVTHESICDSSSG